MKPTKKNLITILEKANKLYMKEFPLDKKGIKSHWFREYLKENATYSESDYIKLFGSFENFKKEIDIKKIRDNLSIIKNVTKESTGKKYIVSSIIQGEKIDIKSIESMESYCKHKNAELILLTMRGVHLKSFYGDDIFSKYGKYFATEFIFNESLVAKDFILNPQMILPTTGLRRLGKKKHSLIIASPKQFLQVLPSSVGSVPHLLYTTGTICKPDYSETRVGVIAEQDNLIGGLIVEVLNKEKFNIRNIQMDSKGGFYDLDTYFFRSNNPRKIKAEAIVCGDFHFGVESKFAEGITKEIIKHTNPKSIIMHDVFDAASVNPHMEVDMLARLQRKEHQKTLERELDYLDNKLTEWSKEFKDKKIIITASNHDHFVNRYLSQRKFMYDEDNFLLSCELILALGKYKKNPLEYYIKTIKGNSIKNIEFLKVEDSHKIEDIECGRHGHLGHSGGRGSITSHEMTFGKSVTGHTHSPQIIRDTFTVGCNCEMDQPYTKGSGSAWLHANCLIYKGGIRQMILMVNDKWKL